MTVRPITIVGHRALSQRTRRVREVTSELRALVADMFETNDAASGAGLAAPQVGSRSTRRPSRAASQSPAKDSPPPATAGHA